MGILCLTVASDSDQMWSEYASKGVGFVIGFDTTHAEFRKLTAPMGVLKIFYSTEGFPTFLGMMQKNPFAPLYRKRMQYSYEQQWRSLRLLKDLEQHSGEVYVAQFDPACVCRVVIRRGCTTRDKLEKLVEMDARYRHVEIVVR